MRNSSCILYAEDDENDALLLRHAFAQAGIPDCRLQVVTSGQEAIDYIRGAGEYSDRSLFPFPALLLLDLKMPHKTGMDVLEWVRQEPQTCRLVVIIYTSSHHESDIGRAYDLGVNSFTVKPSTLGEIVEFAKDLKTWWLDRNQFAPATEVPRFHASC